jgi:hypothetical protein
VGEEGGELLKADPQVKALTGRWGKAKDLTARTRKVPIAPLNISAHSIMEHVGLDRMYLSEYEVLTQRMESYGQVADALKRDGNEATYDNLAQEQEKLFLQAQEVRPLP